MNAPTVTVAIPTFKGAVTLGAAIESVLSQTFQDFELVIVDDNSPDDTPHVVAGFQDPRVRYFRNPENLGPEGNWNRCRALARGRYFKLLPHDDLLFPACLQRQVAVLHEDADEALALVFSARQVLAPDGRKLMRRGYPSSRSGRIAGRRVTSACVQRGTNLIGEPGAVLFRSSLAARVGPFDATDPYVIDLDYWVRLLAHGDAYYHAEPLAAFRIGLASWSVALGARQGSDFRHMVSRHIARGLLQPGLVDQMLGRFTPTLNGLARRVFYRIYARA